MSYIMYYVSMNYVTLSSKGQIVLPSKIRNKFHLKKGDKLLIEKKKDTILLKPIHCLAHLKGIDNLKDSSKDLKKLRKEWDEEF
ncbi:MAG: AbrB/MazE/SpoVT family DNA-binding domain-containing protein [Thermoplasmatota archaeon]